MTQEITIGEVTSTVISYKDQRVCTTRQLAQFYGCSEKNIGDNYDNNRDRFEEGKHFVRLDGDALRAFKAGLPDEIGEPLKFAPKANFWTERGAARHAKMLTTTEAWEIFEQLEDHYFAVKAPALPVPETFTSIRVRGRSPLEQMKLISFAGDALKDVPGIRLDVVAAAKLQAFEQYTGIDFSEFRRALPPVALDRMVHFNPTQIGARVAEQAGRVKISAQLVNKILLDLGLQRQVERGYVLTEVGMKYGEVLPFRAKNEHAGLQIDWWETVVDIVRENMPAEVNKRRAANSVVSLQLPPHQQPQTPLL